MNPYLRTPEKVIAPPTTIGGTLKRLGPGFVLSASIVGSGELIATTLFGAEVGFICLWIILFSCLVKVAVQIEFGRFTVFSGKTSMQALDDLPGPKFGRAGWAVWFWFVIQSLKTLQVGGVIGGVALVLNALIPFSPLAWAVVAAIIAMSIIFRGIYSPIEKWSIIMIALFTLFTLASLIALQWTPFAITNSEFFSGFSFSLPAGALLLAIGAFAITGVGGDEILAYNYWLIEKGYASHTGPEPKDERDREAWLVRARGWIRVMQIDALASMVCYTLMTALFYLLGAAILHGQGLTPKKGDLVQVLSRMYTDTLGPWANNVFLIGALVVLFSTLLAALAAWTRLFSDAFGRFGWITFEKETERKKSIAFLSVLFPIIWTLLFFTFQAPGLMIIIGGSLTTLILFIVVYASLIMRYRWLPAELRPGQFFDITLWLSSIAIAGVGVYSAVKFAL
ncbi:Nramp family divalent metal transporter [Akkermansiaceae bacterium]|nr:Nramp family divalent metal transporter [Akkermansiaceae bacterium]